LGLPDRRLTRHASPAEEEHVKHTAQLCLVVLLSSAFHAPPVVAATPAATCVAAKHKASGRWLDRTLGCLSRSAKAGDGLAGACLSRYDATLASTFVRAEERGGCPVVGDLPTVESKLDACVAVVRSVTELDAPTLPPTRCGGEKLRAAGKRLKAELTCHTKAIQRAVPVEPACLDSAQHRLDDGFVKAERHPDCVQTSDAANASLAAAMCLAGLLDDGQASCSDGTRNGTETDVDCGGSTCGACSDGGLCSGDADCSSNRCVAGRCAPPDANPVCSRWLADRSTLTEGTWSGNLTTCSIGDVSADGRASALRSLNLYRWLANLPAVADDPAKNQRAQACALLMHANGQLRHDPPPSWACWTQAGADGAATSNIAMARGVTAVDIYMFDPGNSTTIGHRRWILSNWLDTVGLGSTSGYSCMSVVGAGGAGAAPWTAWPPPGVVPYAATRSGGFGTVDVTGWTVQSDTIDLRTATVTLREDGIIRPVTVTHLVDGYGSIQALRFNPNGWQSAAGHTYEVTLGNVTTPIHYSVTIVSCS
jgi:hypothetical protein